MGGRGENVVELHTMMTLFLLCAARGKSQTETHVSWTMTRRFTQCRETIPETVENSEKLHETRSPSFENWYPSGCVVLGH